MHRGDVGGRYPPLPSRRRGELERIGGHVWVTAHRLVPVYDCQSGGRIIIRRLNTVKKEVRIEVERWEKI